MLELKKCPFCGKKPMSTEWHGRRKAWEVYCTTVSCLIIFVVMPTRKMAEELWNKRRLNA